MSKTEEPEGIIIIDLYLSIIQVLKETSKKAWTSLKTYFIKWNKFVSYNSLECFSTHFPYNSLSSGSDLSLDLAENPLQYWNLLKRNFSSLYFVG